jgi:hypothetical protein
MCYVVRRVKMLWIMDFMECGEKVGSRVADEMLSMRLLQKYVI